MKVKTLTKKSSDKFDIRSQISYSNLEQSRALSIQSQDIPVNDVSNTIDAMIIEQKKKCIPSKTDNTMVRNQGTVKTKRIYSISNVSTIVPPLALSQIITRILNSTKIYPNYPNIFNIQRNQSEMDSIYGAFFGFLIGDIVGSYMAYITRDFQMFIPDAIMMNGGGTYKLGPSQGTDQTQILFSLCYGLIQGQGVYNRNLIASKYMEWFESKPFNFSAVFALAMQELRKRKVQKIKIQAQKVAEILLQSSQKNKNQQSSIGLIRILPLTLFSLKFCQKDFQNLIRDQLLLICPNQLVIETGYVYAKILRIIILTHDHQRAFYQASKWIYKNGSPKLKQLWKSIQKGEMTSNRYNIGKLKTSFLYSSIEINKKQIKFIDSLTSVLMKGGDTETNCAVVLTLIGAIVGYNGIPRYFKQKIINSRANTNNWKGRDKKYCIYNVIDIIQNIRKVQKQRYIKEN